MSDWTENILGHPIVDLRFSSAPTSVHKPKKLTQSNDKLTFHKYSVKILPLAVNVFLMLLSDANYLVL